MNEQTRTPNPAAAPEAALIPAVDVFEDATGITLYADLPGVPKDRLTIEVEGELLTISGAVALDAPEGMDASHAEVALPRYRSAFTLSKELDPSKVLAEHRQGVLKLRIPKLEHVQPKKVVVQVA
jgi:HSP20 family molecular chaperone IbpA